MSIVYHTSDWHLGHHGIERFRHDVRDSQENAEMILDNYRRTIKKRDTVYFHGDILFNKVYLDEVKNLPGTKHLILGNHDLDKDHRPSLIELMFTFDSVSACIKKGGTWMVHIPMHPDELRGSLCIHGHTHYHNIDDSRYFNVSVEQTGYTPIKRQELLGDIFKNQNIQRVLREY